MQSIVILGNYSINLDIFGKTEDEIRRSGEPWVLNFWHKSYKIKPDLIFNIHNNFFGKSNNKYKVVGENDRAELASAYNAARCPVVIIGANDYLDNAAQFDVKSAVDMFGADVFTSTITYEMAHALMVGVEEIHLWGFNMINDIEYEPQIPAVLHMIDRAGTYGVKVDAPMRDRWMEEARSRGIRWDKLPKVEKMYHEIVDG